MDQIKSALRSLQQSIYQEMKSKAFLLEGEVSKEVLEYRKEQEKFALRDFTLSHDKDLILSILSSQVIYIGDFHSFDQSGRNLVRLLQLGGDKGQKISIGIEFVEQDLQGVVDAFLSGHISEYEFLEEINYSETWRFPWSHYRIFFELAKKHHFHIYALNTKGTLKERDERAAQRIVEIIEKDPLQRLYILFGELHIVPSKIPEMTRQKSESVRQCIIHQNLDEPYWKIHHQDIDNDSYLIKFKDDEFSLQTSPPWTKYESMIYWYEHLSMNLDFDAYDHFTSPPPPEDLLENVIFYTLQTSNILGLKLEKQSLEDINLYDHQDLDFISKLLQNLKNEHWKHFIEKMIALGHSFTIPNTNVFYCSSYSINRISHIAGIHLFNLEGSQISFYHQDSPSKIDFFIYYFKQETIAYFTSKVINPFLKCDLYSDLKRNESESLVIKIIENREAYNLYPILKGYTLIEIFNASRSLGRYCGEMLYELIMPKSIKEYQEIKTYLFGANTQSNAFIEKLDQLISQKHYKDHRKRIF